MEKIETTRVIETCEHAVLLSSSEGTRLVETTSKSAADALAEHHNTSFPLFDEDHVTATVVTRAVRTTVEYGTWN